LKIKNEKIPELTIDKKISNDSISNVIRTWNKYPKIEKTGQNYLFYYEDPFFGSVPVRLFIPASYDPLKKSPLILLLHGAVQLSSFNRSVTATSNESDDDDLFFSYLSKQKFIIVRPYADPGKQFNWVSKSSRKSVNRTYQCLVDIIVRLKHQFNIDDSRIFAFGHSDGSDGAFCMGLYKPGIFAGFICYNSMLNNIGAHNIYLKNTVNRPFYIVHSDLDDIRPILQTRKIAAILKDSVGADIRYKEYTGYKHFDKHLQMDLPNAAQFMAQTIRDPFHRKLYWEANNNLDNTCDWIKVDSFDLSAPKASWHKGFDIKTYNKIAKRWENFQYYLMNEDGYAVSAKYHDNIFEVEVSRVREFEIYISDKMVDIHKPVKVIVNGKPLFDKKMSPDKNFMIKNFEENFDRQAIWINRVKIVVK